MGGIITKRKALLSTFFNNFFYKKSFGKHILLVHEINGDFT